MFRSIVETSAGWRGEFAYPHTLFEGRELKPLAAAYGVELDD